MGLAVTRLPKRRDANSIWVVAADTSPVGSPDSICSTSGVVAVIGNSVRLEIDSRRAEIEVTKLVGGSNAFVRRPFLYEGFFYGLIGGVLGIGIALLIGLLFERLGGNFSMVYSSASIVTAFAVSTLIGVVFGFLPARNAARLDPVDALARQ